MFAAETQHNLFSLMPACQICISEMAEVTDNDAAIQNATQSNQDIKKIFAAAHRLLFFYL
jgi:hypothetical protein